MHFYQFLGAHSLLIGLLPFFLPVYLWSHGLGLAGLSLLVGVSGLAFAASLHVWQGCCTKWPLRRLIALTFVLEISLVFVVGIFTMIPGMALFNVPAETYASANTAIVMAACGIGLVNGMYNAFFWTTQRTLFLQQLGRNDTGKQYGNFQIFVTLFLKLGIVLGGFLLENGGFLWLLALSAGIGAIANSHLASYERARIILYKLPERVSIWQSLRFSDHRGSRTTFAVDGLFLYLESHFWTLSLFLVVQQDFTKLGLAVVLLALGFALMFFIIKNRIDTLAIERLYHAAVLLYTLSWLLRFTLSEESHGAGLLVTLLVITFFSSFFRLAFNKRFFDVARHEGDVRYLLLKSYCSQLILGMIFTALGIVLFLFPTDAQLTLQALYAGAAVLSLSYLTYKDRPSG